MGISRSHDLGQTEAQMSEPLLINQLLWMTWMGIFEMVSPR
ncbi:hypothetical protein SynSYN20_01461 [Synechococcus sp. SYN20]|nr:hypothetical protein SynSYN20_01461 [Synechococcus sp. SYN20]